MDDEAIRAALRRGDTKAAFGMIYQLYGDVIYWHCRRYLKDPSAAKDAMQQTLMAAFQSKGKLLHVDQMRGWLLKIARNKCSDARRASARRDRLHRDASAEGNGEVADVADGFEHLMIAENERAFHDCIDALKADDANLVLMQIRDHMSLQEIAEIVARPVDTIRMRIRRASKRLRTCIQSKNRTP